MQALAEKAVYTEIEVEADQPTNLTVQVNAVRLPEDEATVYLGQKIHSTRATVSVVVQEEVLPAPVTDFIAAARAHAQRELAELAAAALEQQKSEAREQAEAAAARVALKEERARRAAAKKEKLKQEKREARERAAATAAAAAEAAAAAAAEQGRLAAAAAAEAALAEEQRLAAVAAAAAQAERETAEAAQRQLEQDLAAAAVTVERLRAEQDAITAAAAAAAARADSSAAAVTYGEAAMRAANDDAGQLAAIAVCTDVFVLTAQLEEAVGREGLKYVRKAIRKQIKRLNAVAAATAAAGSGQDSSALEAWLAELGLQQHLPLFVASGYYSVDSVQGASDAELKWLGMPEGARLQFIEAAKRTAAAVDAVDKHGDGVDDGTDSGGLCRACWDVPPEVRLTCCRDSAYCRVCVSKLPGQLCSLCREPIIGNIECC
jgi:hypothetical protein